MQIFLQGQLNLSALLVPDVYVQILSPAVANFNGVPTNVLGYVGAASWGPVNSASQVGNATQLQTKFGLPVNRKYDLVTHASVVMLQGANNLQLVRVTDGTDVAASAAVKDTGAATGATLTGIWTGSYGNLMQYTMASGSTANTYKLTVSQLGYSPEIYDNLSPGVAALTPTAGTGYTSVPILTISAPAVAGSIQATATASLVVISDTVVAGGTGYAVNDTVTLANGVVLKVTAVTTGAITTATVQSAGSITSGSVPTNPVAQVSSSGAGTGATFNLTWGLGPATITQPGTGYTGAAPTVTLSGGGGTGGSYTSAVSIWPNLVSAVNNGNSPTRGPSKLVVASIGNSLMAPQLTTSGQPFAGGADGATGVTSTQLVGVDGALGTRSGMYALRRTGCSIAALADCDTSTTWTTQLAFGNSEAIYMIMTGPAGQTPSAAVTALNTAGIASPTTSYNAKLMLGDWCYWNDPVNAVTRLISPQPFVSGLLANLAPQNSSLNKQVFGLIGTQTSLQNQTYATSDLQTLGAAGIDVICNPVPGGSYFGVRFGRNLSTGGPATNNDTYTRMTNYLALTIGGAMGQYVGQNQSISATDPLRAKVKGSVDSFLTNMQAPLANPPQIDVFQTICDLTNNSPSSIGAGNLILQANIRYLAVVSNIILNLQGGQTVQIVSINSQPAQA